MYLHIYKRILEVINLEDDHVNYKSQVKKFIYDKGNKQ